MIWDFNSKYKMDNLLLESLLDLTGAEMTFSNGRRYGVLIVSGLITRNDLWNIIPVNLPVSRVEPKLRNTITGV